MTNDEADLSWRREAISLLRFYSEAGIEIFVDEAPRDRFAETLAEVERRRGAGSGQEAGMPARARMAAPPPSAGSSPSASAGESDRRGAGDPAREARRTDAGSSSPQIGLNLSEDALIADGRERARSARTLAELQEALRSFEGCGLRVTAKTCVFGNGREDADLMLVGEAPGREEDLAGEPFVGRSGRLLDRMLQAIGLDRADVRVTNTVPWRPPGNRPPTPMETAMCLPFVQRQIELVSPKVLVCLGNPASKALLDADEGILRLRGKWKSYTMHMSEGGQIPAIAMLHPAYLLRNPIQKRLAWRDLLALQQKLSELTAS
ncbi:uracil-DNA glycosylase [Fulvimarina endophytica]|uniref:Type-4 uracil-DNA glycosylase n=1 Tax=Fulvimarina endophytica TaxID=2293836 RepID=A0A371X7I3_9HYPH|nr:uracil-DNA glycosylase [Fulvimarina endophytica]RFC65190.1 uracil-DNA glycosylase [Fulvimarina endophytica]